MNLYFCNVSCLEFRGRYASSQNISRKWKQQTGNRFEILKTQSLKSASNENLSHPLNHRLETYFSIFYSRVTYQRYTRVLKLPLKCIRNINALYLQHLYRKIKDQQVQPFFKIVDIRLVFKIFTSAINIFYLFLQKVKKNFFF